MRIHTIEENFEYQMKQIVKEMKRQYEDLAELDAEELQDEIWKNYSKEFGRMVMERCNEYSGDEIFE